MGLSPAIFRTQNYTLASGGRNQLCVCDAGKKKTAKEEIGSPHSST